jgi:predicted nucleotidyltransferase
LYPISCGQQPHPPAQPYYTGEGEATFPYRHNGKPKKTKEQRGPRKRRRAKKPDAHGGKSMDNDDDDSDSESERSSNLSSLSDFSALANLMNRQQFHIVSGNNGSVLESVSHSHRGSFSAGNNGTNSDHNNNNSNIVGEGSGIDALFSWLRRENGISSSPTLQLGTAASEGADSPSKAGSSHSTHGQWLQMQYEWLLSKTHFVEEDEFQLEQAERRKWSLWAVHASESERQRRIQVLKDLDAEQDQERAARRKMANELIERERNERISNQFMASLASSHWFSEITSAYSDDYELVCPYYKLGCRVNCRRSTLRQHLLECEFCLDLSSYLNKDKVDGEVSSTASTDSQSGAGFVSAADVNKQEILEYEVVCPNAIMGCRYSGNRNELSEHLQQCQFRGKTVEQEQEERRRLKQLVIDECEEERSRRVLDDEEGDAMSPKSPTSGGIHTSGAAGPKSQFANKASAMTVRNAIIKAFIKADKGEIDTPEPAYDSQSDDNMLSSSEEDLRTGSNRRFKTGTGVPTPTNAKTTKKSRVHGILQSQHEAVLVQMHKEIDLVWHNFHQFQETSTKPVANKLVRDLEAVIKDLWPFSKLELFGSFVTGVIGRSSDIDIVVYFADEFKELLTVRGAIPLLHSLASHLESHGKDMIHINNVLLHARIPIIKAESIISVDSMDFITGEKTSKPVKLSIDISIDGPNHSGLATTQLVTTLMRVLPPLGPVALVLKEYLKSKSLSDTFTGGLPSYGLIMLLLLPILQHIRMQQPQLAQAAALAASVSMLNRPKVAALPLPPVGNMSPTRHKKDYSAQLPMFQTPRSRSQSDASNISISAHSTARSEDVGVGATSGGGTGMTNVHPDSAAVRRKSLPPSSSTAPSTGAPPQYEQPACQQQPASQQPQQQLQPPGSARNRPTVNMSPLTHSMQHGSSGISGISSSSSGSGHNVGKFPDFAGNNAPVRRRSGEYAYQQQLMSRRTRKASSSASSVVSYTWATIDQQREYGHKVAMKILCNDAVSDSIRQSLVSTPVAPSHVGEHESSTNAATNVAACTASMSENADASSSDNGEGSLSPASPQTAASSQPSTAVPISSPSSSASASTVSSARLGGAVGLESPRQFIESECPIYGVLLEAVCTRTHSFFMGIVFYLCCVVRMCVYLCVSIVP